MVSAQDIIREARRINKGFNLEDELTEPNDQEVGERLRPKPIIANNQSGLVYSAPNNTIKLGNIDEDKFIGAYNGEIERAAQMATLSLEDMYNAIVQRGNRKGDKKPSILDTDAQIARDITEQDEVTKGVRRVDAKFAEEPSSEDFSNNLDPEIKVSREQGSYYDHGSNTIYIHPSDATDDKIEDTINHELQHVAQHAGLSSLESMQTAINANVQQRFKGKMPMIEGDALMQEKHPMQNSWWRIATPKQKKHYKANMTPEQKKRVTKKSNSEEIINKAKTITRKLEDYDQPIEEAPPEPIKAPTPEPVEQPPVQPVVQPVVQPTIQPAPTPAPQPQVAPVKGRKKKFKAKEAPVNQLFDWRENYLRRIILEGMTEEDRIRISQEEEARRPDAFLSMAKPKGKESMADMTHSNGQISIGSGGHVNEENILDILDHEYQHYLQQIYLAEGVRDDNEMNDIIYNRNLAQRNYKKKYANRKAIPGYRNGINQTKNNHVPQYEVDAISTERFPWRNGYWRHLNTKTRKKLIERTDPEHISAYINDMFRYDPKEIFDDFGLPDKYDPKYYRNLDSFRSAIHLMFFHGMHHTKFVANAIDNPEQMESVFGDAFDAFNDTIDYMSANGYLPHNLDVEIKRIGAIKFQEVVDKFRALPATDYKRGKVTAKAIMFKASTLSNRLEPDWNKKKEDDRAFRQAIDYNIVDDELNAIDSEAPMKRNSDGIIQQYPSNTPKMPLSDERYHSEPTTADWVRRLPTVGPYIYQHSREPIKQPLHDLHLKPQHPEHAGYYKRKERESYLTPNKFSRDASVDDVRRHELQHHNQDMFVYSGMNEKEAEEYDNNYGALLIEFQAKTRALRDAMDKHKEFDGYSGYYNQKPTSDLIFTERDAILAEDKPWTNLYWQMMSPQERAYYMEEYMDNDQLAEFFYDIYDTNSSYMFSMDTKKIFDIFGVPKDIRENNFLTNISNAITSANLSSIDEIDELNRYIVENIDKLDELYDFIPDRVLNFIKERIYEHAEQTISMDTYYQSVLLDIYNNKGEDLGLDGYVGNFNKRNPSNPNAFIDVKNHINNLTFNVADATDPYAIPSAEFQTLTPEERMAILLECDPKIRQEYISALIEDSVNRHMFDQITGLFGMVGYDYYYNNTYSYIVEAVHILAEMNEITSPEELREKELEVLYLMKGYDPHFYEKMPPEVYNTLRNAISLEAKRLGERTNTIMDKSTYKTIIKDAKNILNKLDT